MKTEKITKEEPTKLDWLTQKEKWLKKIGSKQGVIKSHKHFVSLPYRH